MMKKTTLLYHLLIVLAVFLCAEWFVRLSIPQEKVWYEQAEEFLANNSAQALFIGSSRTEIGVLADEFDARLKTIYPNHKSLNLGRGFSTHEMHYLGIRNLLEEHSESLENAVLFIEISKNLPPVFINKGSWVFDVQQQLILPVLRFKDLVPLWRSPTSPTAKRSITMRYFLSYSQTINKREYIRENFLSYGTNLIQSFNSTKVTEASLGEGTTVRGDEESIKFARELAYMFAQKDIQEQVPYGRFEDHAIYPIIMLAKEYGLKVVFVNIPLSSVQSEPLQTPLRLEEAERFKKTAKSWNIPIYSVPSTFDDSNFPDLWHLKPEAAQQFTDELAALYLSDLSTLTKSTESNPTHD